MVIILFFHLLFGLWFAYRTYTSSSIFSDFVIKSCVFAYLVLLLLLSQTGTLWFIAGIHLPVFIWIIAEYAWIKKRKQSFHQQFCLLLDSIIARMKMGHSFRESLNLSIDSIQSVFIKQNFEELKDRMIYSQSPGKNAPKDVLFAFQTFQTADQDHQPITRLRYIRSALKIESRFQNKVQQALLQIHLQSIILIILYLALFVFVLMFFGLQFLSLVLCSLFLFSLGVCIVFAMGRKIKWTL